ncbi:hypothetical protein AB833_18780 [Chromatiales bacterium (ex Bugula neritina AB1)]|nr:hypothetical protein AB833_18780 [Chromatiales bacterium (ex Bugula neritina AB1)]
MKSQDILILLKLVSLGVDKPADAFNQSARNLAEMTGVGKTEVNKSLNRSINVGLAINSSLKGFVTVNRKGLFEFTFFGLSYVFPVRPLELTRGIPTALAAPVLRDKLLSPGGSIPVWPSAAGEHMGQAVTPLYKTVPQAVAHDDMLYASLALVDAIRIGGAREKKIAAEELRLLLSIS